MLKRSLVINPKDNVAVLLEPAQKDDTVMVNGTEITLLEDIEFAHKVTLDDLKKGDSVFKYGEKIGHMLVDAPKGTWIHNHVMGCERGMVKRGEKA